MLNTMIKAAHNDKIIYFDPKVFEFLIPAPTPAEAEKILRQMSQALADKDNLTAYVARIYAYPTDKDGFAPRTGAYPLQVLVTYADHAFERETLIMPHEAKEVHLEQLNHYHQLSDIPHLFTPMKEWYAKHEADYVKNIADIMAKKMTHCDKLTLPSVSHAQTPTRITSDTFHMQSSQLSARFQLPLDTIDNLIQIGNTKSKSMIAASDEIYQRYIHTVENDIGHLQKTEKLTTNDAVKTYASYLATQLTPQFIEMKINLLSALYDSDSKIARRIEKLRGTSDAIKHALSHDQFGWALAEVDYIKRELIVTLYQIALRYLQEHWEIARQFKDKHKAAQYRREKIAMINQQLERILTIDPLCRPSAIEDTLARLSPLSLSELEKLTDTLLAFVNTKYLSASETLNDATVLFKDANQRVSAVTEIAPYQLTSTLINKAMFKLSPAALQLEVKAQYLLNNAQQNIATIQNKQRKTTEVLTLLDEDLKKNFDQLVIHSSQAVMALTHYKKLIVAKAQCDEWLQRSCQACDADDLCLIQLPLENFMTHLQQYADQHESSDTPKIVMAATADLHQIHLTIQTAITKVKAEQQTLQRVYQRISNDSVITTNTTHKAIGFINNIQQHLLAIDTLTARYLREKNQLSTLIDAPRRCNDIIASVQSATQLLILGKEAWSYASIQQHAAQITQAIHQLDELTSVLALYQPKALQILVTAHIARCQQAIRTQQDNVNILLYCHALVTELLHVEKWSTFFAKEAVTLNQRRYKIDAAIKPLFNLLTKTHRDHWQYDPQLATQLLETLRESAMQHTSKQQTSQQFLQKLATLTLPVSEVALKQQLAISHHIAGHIKRIQPQDLSVIETQATLSAHSSHKGQTQQDNSIGGFFDRHRKTIILTSIIIGTVAAGACTFGLLSLFGIIGGMTAGTATMIASSSHLMSHAFIIGGATTASMALGTGMLTGITKTRAANRQPDEPQRTKGSSALIATQLKSSKPMLPVYAFLPTRQTTASIPITVRATSTLTAHPNGTDSTAWLRPRGP